jgi:hypothetical protein
VTWIVPKRPYQNYNIYRAISQKQEGLIGNSFSKAMQFLQVGVPGKFCDKFYNFCGNERHTCAVIKVSEFLGLNSKSR